MIFANILLPELKSLIKEFNYILDYNGVLIISGILIYQKNHLINLYRKFKIYPVKISEEEKWITITFKKKMKKLIEFKKYLRSKNIDAYIIPNMIFSFQKNLWKVMKD